MSSKKHQREDSLKSLDEIMTFIDPQRSILRRQDLISPQGSRSKKILNILLVGKTGHGKSATGNSTLGRKEFNSKNSTASVTSEIKRGQVEYENFIVNIIDSPGLADTSYSDNRHEELLRATENFEKAMFMCPEGIHSFLFVFTFGNRFTSEEQITLEWLRCIFGPFFMQPRGILVFTGGDLFHETMEADGTPEKDFDQWCLDQKGALATLIKECSNRYVLFTNPQENEEKRKMQIKQLIDFMETFHEPYYYHEFCEWRTVRDRLIVELKEPQLTGQLNIRINSIKSEIERLSGIEFRSSQFRRFDELINNLKMEIQIEDKGTGLLNGLKDDLSYVRSEVNQQKQRQNNTRSQQQDGDRCHSEECKCKCHIL